MKGIDIKTLMTASKSMATTAMSREGRAARDAKVIAQAKEQAPGVPVYYTHVDDDLLVFRPACEAVWDSFMARAEAGPMKPADGFDLALECLLFPTADEFNAMIAVRPGLRPKMTEEVLRINGISDDYNLRRG